MINPYKVTDLQLEKSTTKINHRAIATRITIAVSVLVSAMIATLIKISSTEYPFFGPDQYVIQAVPYLSLIVLTILFRRSIGGATISLISALMLGLFGVFVVYTAGGEIDIIGVTPLALFVGCGLVVVVQLIRIAIGLIR